LLSLIRICFVLVKHLFALRKADISRIIIQTAQALREAYLIFIIRTYQSFSETQKTILGQRRLFAAELGEDTA